MVKSFEVRDHRNKAMFRVDDEYLNGYAKLCGIYATGVYNCLCRHANHLTQSSFPSIELMADKLGIGRDSVLKGMRALEEWGIIVKERARSAETGKWLHNSYTLVDKSFWKPKPDQVGVADMDNQVGNSDSPSRCGRLSQVGVADTKVTHIKVTHNNQCEQSSLVAEVIKLFESVNPACKSYYGNRTQRSAAESLVSTYGFEEVSKIIAILPKVNKTPYFPSINTPKQLWEKYQTLKDRLLQKKIEFDSKKVKVAF